MEIALIHNNSLILGPMGFNVRMINYELEDLEVGERIGPQSYTDLPIHFSDNLTHLVISEKEIPSYDSRYHNVGNFTWEIIKENDIPTSVRFTYPILEKTLEEVKYLRKQELKPERKQKENTTITVNINGNNVEVPTSREERLILSSKLVSNNDFFNYKFTNTWLEINTKDIKYIISEIDKVVQQAFDWELSKMQEIDACSTIDEVYAVAIQEQ